MAAELRRPYGLLSSVRVRTTFAAVVVVGVALVAGALLLVSSLRLALTKDVQAAAERRAVEIAAALELGEEPSLAVSDDDEEFVQVLGPDGRVVAASENVDQGAPVVDPETADERNLDVRVDDETEPFRVVVEDAGDQIVVVGRTLDDVGESTGTVGSLLTIGAPVLLTVVGFVTWWVVGRALRPVDRIRREVDEITVTELDRRVPEPGSGDEIGRLARTMNRMLARLEQGQAAQRRFVSDAAHELRSPVASLRLHAEVGTPELQEVALAESRRMQDLIDGLLLLARADEGGSDVARRPVDLDDAVFAEADRLRSETDLRVDIRGVGAGRVLGDPVALARVLRNLGQNAARHAATTVAFALAEAGGDVVLHVDDDGPGIPEAERERVFERFVRLDESRARDAGGAGLGLAIVREVVAAHGGSVVATAGPLGGARLTVTLPAAPDT